MTEQSAHITYYHLFLAKQPAGIQPDPAVFVCWLTTSKGISNMFSLGNGTYSRIGNTFSLGALLDYVISSAVITAEPAVLFGPDFTYNPCNLAGREIWTYERNGCTIDIYKGSGSASFVVYVWDNLDELIHRCEFSID